jgi:acyl carrier protein
MMTRDESLEHVRGAILETVSDVPKDITESTDLVADGILDSLDQMNFLFQLEKRLDTKLASIDEDYQDFRVSSLVDIVMRDAA